MLLFRTSNRWPHTEGTEGTGELQRRKQKDDGFRGSILIPSGIPFFSHLFPSVSSVPSV
jgi:hypothetical protein